MDSFSDNSVESVIGRVLGVPVVEIRDSLQYQSIHQWDSLRHVAIMHRLEKEFGVSIDGAQRERLRSVADIKRFLGMSSSEFREQAKKELFDRQGVHRGLEGVYFDESSITHIEAETGTLEYRGYPIQELVEHCKFEEVIHLLLFGSLPTELERQELLRQIKASLSIPTAIQEFIKSAKYLTAEEALIISVTMLGAMEQKERRGNELISHGIRLIAVIPLIMALHHAHSQSLHVDQVAFGDNMSFAEYIYRLLGLSPGVEIGVDTLNRILIVHADHGSNASTFTLRTVASTGATLYSAVTGAISAFSGPLHGGAIEAAIKQIDEIGSPSSAAAFVSRKIEDGTPVMGFGHRVYKREDPRVRHLRRAALAVSEYVGDLREFQTAEALVDAMAPMIRHGLCPNVDLYAAIAYRKLGLPDSLAIGMFIIGRTVGWVAHFLEQSHRNILIRPLMKYNGPPRRTVEDVYGCRDT